MRVSPAVRIAMPRVETLAPDVLMLVGTLEESVAVALLDGAEALLVDGLAGPADAGWLQFELEARGVRPRQLVSTHAMDDHGAAFALWPDLPLLNAHNGDGRHVRWGRHRVALFANPGKTADMLNLELPDADLLIAGDNLIGPMVYLSHAAPATLDAGLECLIARGRGRVVAGHQGVYPAAALHQARHYLQRLLALRDAVPALHDCLAPGLTGTAFEQRWHAANLERLEALA